MQEFPVKVDCTYCQEEIRGIRIECCKCSDFDICFQCFTAGAEIGQHKKEHPYKLHDWGNTFITRGSWTGKQQLQLLDAVELYGFGSWNHVSDHVDSKTPEECKEEYISRFLEGSIGQLIWGKVCRSSNVYDHTSDDELSQMSLEPYQCTAEEADMLGYWPLMDCFKRESDVEAEELLSGLHLDFQSSNIFTSLNVGITDMYRRRLRDRFKKKWLAKEYKLITKYCKDNRDDNQDIVQSEEKSNKLITFAQFLSAKNFEKLVASLEKEVELRQKLSELIKYKNSGLLTQEEILNRQQLTRKIYEAHICPVPHMCYSTECQHVVTCNEDQFMEIEVENDRRVMI